MKLTEEQLREKGYVETPNGSWIKRGVNEIDSVPRECVLMPPPKPPKRIRQSSKPLMNKLETEALAHLKAELSDPVVLVQSVRFRLGNGIWYKPDFFIFGLDKPTAYEVKGPHAFRGGFENLKVAASLYPEVRWGLIWKEKTGRWVGQTVLP